MQTERNFFLCKHCSNFASLIKASGAPIICCGEPMAELVPNTTDAAAEKHVPAVAVRGNAVEVKVGSAPHPTLPEHHIEFIYLQTEKGGQRKNIPAGEPATANFLLTDDKPVAAFEYCNLHGLWKTDIKY